MRPKAEWAIDSCLLSVYIAITFHNNLTEAKIENELIASVQSLNILHLSLLT